jgi:cardiolipin synthase
MYRQIPNYLTYFRIALIPALVAAFYMPPPWGYQLCMWIFLTAGISDFLDGYLARIWNVQSNIGRFLDPIADKLIVATALMLLVSDVRPGYFEGRAMMIPAVLIICREILVSGLREYLAEARVSVPVSNLAKWKTSVQMLAIGMLLFGNSGLAWLNPGITGNFLLWVAAILTLFTGYAYIRTGWKHMES